MIDHSPQSSIEQLLASALEVNEQFRRINEQLQALLAFTPLIPLNDQSFTTMRAGVEASYLRATIQQEGKKVEEPS
ncbi:MAG TPA: hypothetical protein VIZ18_06635 [Ktedonobacteraceae bacterium]